MRTSTLTRDITRKARPRTASLQFHALTKDDIQAISSLLPMSRSRANDFTVGGLLMWSDYFKYEVCIISDTLFVKGVSEINPSLTAFSLPVGRLPLKQSVGMITAYCREKGLKLRFSAVPADRLPELQEIIHGRAQRLDDWSDYIYDIKALASLGGKKLGKKRNHVNRFMAENPGFTLRELTAGEVNAVRDTYRQWMADGELSADSAVEESVQTLEVLDNLDRYPFEGAVLRDGAGRIVAFTLGEVIGDTLYTHIEKMDHTVTGAGETVNKLFAEYMLGRHPSLQYVNREEDAGDPGLRQAKLSYHPAIVLEKFDVTV